MTEVFGYMQTHGFIVISLDELSYPKKLRLSQKSGYMWIVGFTWMYVELY